MDTVSKFCLEQVTYVVVTHNMIHVDTYTQCFKRISYYLKILVRKLGKISWNTTMYEIPVL